MRERNREKKKGKRRKNGRLQPTKQEKEEEK